ncbi:MAG: alpha-mannosidase [Phycisphaerales bacterium]|nr:alpha-mannosidase [Phycisphaerales bacterium]
MPKTILIKLVAVAALFSSACGVAIAHPPTAVSHDLDNEKVLYCVGYAHLDTQWRWDYTTTINTYIPNTLDENFALFEHFPGYVFNFTGSARHAMMKEYYPDKYERLRRYIQSGRWHTMGSSVDEIDSNVPAPESIIRQVLYGNAFFREEYGTEAVDFMLPDCFGFPASLPSIIAHCGLKGFSTQKLHWGSAVGIPFPVGVWVGPDGESVIAALDPGSYGTAIKGRVDRNPEWVARVLHNGEKYGVWADYHYYGVGDMGGAPREEDVRNYLASIGQDDSLIEVALTSSDQMFRDITPAQRARLPRYQGDLLLTEHSAGTLTSEAYMKRWNRKNEILADAAERSAVAAETVAGVHYPSERIYASWIRVLASQMHDILPGTSIPRAYGYSWNDEVIAMNGFASVVTDSTAAIGRALDTDVQGQALVVYNPLAIERDDVVEATVRFGAQSAPRYVRVFDGQGQEIASQILDRSADTVRVLFSAHVPPVSWSVYEVRPSDSPFEAEQPEVQIGERTIENARYRVKLDENGDVSSIVDKGNAGREMLAKPAQLEFTHEKPKNWPAWNMDWNDRQNPPIGHVDGPARIRIVESGPVRCTLEVQREARDSIFTQRIRLAAGDAGARVEFATEIDWQSAECALRASFPFTFGNPNATYTWGVGTIERGNYEPKRYEVPSHEWFDLTDESGDYGVSVLEDSKFGSDKPNDRQLRLTLLYTPGVRKGYLDQHSQDWGRHDITYALYGHAGDWRQGRSEWQARRLNQPLRVFQTDKHKGTLGRTWSFLNVSTPQVDVRALKHAEKGDAVIVRVLELWGRQADNVRIRFTAPVVEAWEVDGQERKIGDAEVGDGTLAFNLSPYHLRSFAVRFDKPAPAMVASRALPLDFDTDVVSPDSARSDGAFDLQGRSYPAELYPDALEIGGFKYVLGATSNGMNNAITCHGQTIELPDGDYERIGILAAADTDVSARFMVGDQPRELTIPEWTGFVGKWDERVWDRAFDEVDYRCEGKVVGITPGFIKRTPIAWFCSHRHHPTRGNEAYQFSYLFAQALPRRIEDRSLRLPNDPRIKIMAVSVAGGSNESAVPAAPLYDDFTDRKPITLRHKYPPPPKPVFEGVVSAARVTTDRAERFDALSMGPPSDADDIDTSKAHDAVFRFYDQDGEYSPHSASGAVGDTLPRLNDGEVARNEDDTERCVWYDNEGRFFIDLGKAVAIDRINTYSWHRDDRAPQVFSLWGSASEEMPSPALTNAEHAGWSLLGVVNTKDLGNGGVHGSSVTFNDPDGQSGRYRHLLWIAQDVGQGTFFTEIDVYFAD